MTIVLGVILALAAVGVFGGGLAALLVRRRLLRVMRVHYPEVLDKALNPGGAATLTPQEIDGKQIIRVLDQSVPVHLQQEEVRAAARGLKLWSNVTSGCLLVLVLFVIISRLKFWRSG